jgi:hypothetical protein
LLKIWSDLSVLVVLRIAGNAVPGIS